MAIESTLAIIKPDAFPRAAEILLQMKRNGFQIAQLEEVTFTKDRAAEFYSEHRERPFFDELTTFMSSGPSMACVLRKEGAIKAWRMLMGPTNPEKAKETDPTSIRAVYGTDGSKNATHGSDSHESATREISFFFPSFTAPPPHTGLNAKEYLNKTVCPLLTKALTQMCRLNPDKPIEWLGQYLLGAAEKDEGTTQSSSTATEEEKPKRPIYFVLGGPGSGKGTQCAKIVEKFKFDHFSAGDLLRAEAASGSEQGAQIDEMIKEGKIVPGEITIGLLKKAIESSTAPGVLIDGFPRKLAQAGSFEKEVSDFEFVLFLDCPEKVMEERILERGKTSGRNDDNEESIRKRFHTFVETSMPVIEYYEAKGKVHRIDGTKTADEVFEAVQALF